MSQATTPSYEHAEWVTLQCATAKVGAILVNINPAYRTSELPLQRGRPGRHPGAAVPLLRHGGAKLYPGATKAQREEAPKRRYRCFKVDATGQPHGCGKVTRLADPVELAVSEAVLARYEGEDLAALVAPDDPPELDELAASLGEDKRRLEQASRDRYRRRGDPLRLEEGQFLAIQAEIKDAMPDALLALRQKALHARVRNR